MKLERRYLRNIKENLGFYISATVLTMVCLMLFTLFDIAGSGIHSFGEEFFAKHNVEDAQFTTFAPLSDEDIKHYEEYYSLEIEVQRYVTFKEEYQDVDTTVRVFHQNQKINTYEVTAGADIQDKMDILISEGYAEYMKYSVGDHLTIDGKEYRISGFFQRPDYLYLLQEVNDTYKNVKSFFIAYMSDEAFSEYEARASFYYMTTYSEATNQLAFRRELNDKFFTRSYLAKEDNNRIKMVYEQADMFRIMGWCMLVVLPFITVALIAIILNRKMKDEQRIIGTLSAQGYSKGRIRMHYSLLAVIPGIIGGVLMIILSSILAQPYGEICLADYEPLHATFRLPWYSAVAGITIPTLLYVFSAYVSVGRLLRKNTVDLLAGKAYQDGKAKKMLSEKRFAISWKYSLRSLLANKGRAFVLFLGLFLGAYMILLCFGIIDCIRYIPKVGTQGFGDFKYEYILNCMDNQETEGETLLVSSYEYNGVSFTLIGVDSNAELLNLKVDGKRADTENGVYVSRVFAKVAKINAGDEITFHNKNSLEEETWKIAGITECTMMEYMVTSKKKVSEITGLPVSTYNAVLSKDRLSIDESKIATVFETSSFNDQMDEMMREMNVMIYSVAIIGAIVLIAAVYVVVDMMIRENASNISMLKVLGYSSRKINGMVLNSNHLILPFALVASYPAAYYTCYGFFNLLTELEGIMLPVHIDFLSILYMIIGTVFCYAVSILLVMRKTNKINMVESLKDNR